MKKEEIEKVEEQNENELNPEDESLTGRGQILLGEIEKVGGILTGNPLAQAEGDFNIKIGNLRKETAEELISQDSEEE